jgi:hypothetical protein
MRTVDLIAQIIGWWIMGLAAFVVCIAAAVFVYEFAVNRYVRGHDIYVIALKCREEKIARRKAKEAA